MTATVAHRFREVDWRDDDLEWDGLDDRVRTAWLDMGNPSDHTVHS